MISLGSIRWTSSNPNITLSFAYEKRRSGVDMQYRAQITVGALNDGSYFGYPIYFKLSIGGTLRESVTLKNVDPYRWSSDITYASDWYTISNKTNGTSPVSFNVYSGLGCSRADTYVYDLPVDPAASEIYAPNGTLGTPLTLTLNRYNSSFTDTITYKCGTASGTVKSGSTTTSITWDTTNGNTVDLAAQNTSGQQVDVTFTVTTYSGSSVVGTNSTKVSLAIPSTVKPSVVMDITDSAGYKNVYGAFIQGHSQLSITVTPYSAYNSPITKYAITADGGSYDTSPVITPPLQGKGTLNVTAKVTDNRGYSSEPVSQPITVLEYAKPVVNLSAYRCDSGGEEDPEGAYMKIEVYSVISSLNNQNDSVYSVRYPGGTFTGSGTSFTSDVLACDISSTCNIEVTISDRISSTTKSVSIPIAYTLLEYYYTGKGISFGKVATRDGFDCAMPAYFTGGVSVAGKSLIDLIYPVGSIYMSVNNASPQTFFGGTWARIQDRFLLAAGSTYTAGGTGGSATHKLTVDELATHYHDGISVDEYFNSHRMAYSNQDHVGTGSSAYWTMNPGTTPGATTARTVDAGGNVAHNNMPPYLTVYMWKRTA